MDNQTQTHGHGHWCENVLKGIPYAIIVTDKKGIITFFNEMAESTSGFSRQQAVGKTLLEVFRIANPEVRIPSARAISQLKTPKFFRRTFLLRKNGGKCLVNASISPVLGDRGGHEGVVVLFRDVSKDVAAERMAVDRQKIEAIGNMARSVAADFSDWLGSISGQASSIADNVIPGTRAHDEAMRIIAMTNQAGGLTKRLLSIAKSGSKSDMKLESVAMGEVIRDAISLVESSFTSRRITFKYKNLDDMPYVVADASQLLDCLMNLFMNAAEAMPGGGTITVDTADASEASKTYVVLRIKDTGVGMTKDVLAQVFEPFFSTKQSASSVGLGLTVVNTSIKNWGGYVRVRSKPGAGTVFKLFIRKAEIQPSLPQHAPATRIGGETILVIDDESETVDYVASILNTAGFKTLGATNGDEGLKLFKNDVDAIKLILLDVVMPNMDGKRILGEILALDPTVSVIMMSGFSRDFVRGYMERGAWGFIQKPFEQNQLLTAVRRTLEQKHTVDRMSCTT